MARQQHQPPPLNNLLKVVLVTSTETARVLDRCYLRLRERYDLPMEEVQVRLGYIIEQGYDYLLKDLQGAILQGDEPLVITIAHNLAEVDWARAGERQGELSHGFDLMVMKNRIIELIRVERILLTSPDMGLIKLALDEYSLILQRLAGGEESS